MALSSSGIYLLGVYCLLSVPQTYQHYPAFELLCTSYSLPEALFPFRPLPPPCLWHDWILILQLIAQTPPLLITYLTMSFLEFLMTYNFYLFPINCLFSPLDYKPQTINSMRTGIMSILFTIMFSTSSTWKVLKKLWNEWDYIKN